MTTKLLYLERANIGNLMFRYMFATHIQRFIPHSVIVGTSMPEWGLVFPDLRPRNAVSVGHKHIIDVPRLVDDIKQPGCDGAIIDCYAMRLEYFEDNRDAFAQTFSTFAGGTKTHDDELVIHVRAGEVLTGLHPDYNLVPVSYYRKLVDDTGLGPAFIGQTGPSVYSDSLRHAFPDARFLAGNHWIDDFQTARNARNIVVAVSSFSWLAAWLSTRARVIFQPQLGLLNPLQRPDVDLSPRRDPRYRFTPFPVERFTGEPAQMEKILG